MQERNTNTKSKNNESDDIDLRIFLKFIFRNKRFIGYSSLIFLILASIYSLTLKRVWEGHNLLYISVYCDERKLH